MNYPEYRQQVKDELAARTALHQQAVSNATISGVLGKPDSPLILLADGDSWFDYPLGGLIPMVSRTDIIAQLPGLCAKPPFILNLAHYGDTSTNEMGLDRTQKIISAIQDGANGKFDGILFSGGGNDVVGDPFCIWLNDADKVSNNPSFGLNQTRFNAILGVIQASFLDLVDLRDNNLPGAPIFVHAYDLAYPTGVPACPTVGPWLKPSLDFCGWANFADATTIVHDALTQLATWIERLASDPANNIQFIPTQGTLQQGDWANELHPNPPGFKQIATKFQAALAAYTPFKGRI